MLSCVESLTRSGQLGHRRMTFLFSSNLYHDQSCSTIDLTDYVYRLIIYPITLNQFQSIQNLAFAISTLHQTNYSNILHLLFFIYFCIGILSLSLILHTSTFILYNGDMGVFRMAY